MEAILMHKFLYCFSFVFHLPFRSFTFTKCRRKLYGNLQSVIIPCRWYTSQLSMVYIIMLYDGYRNYLCVIYESINLLYLYCLVLQGIK